MTVSTWPVALAFVWRPENDGQPLHSDTGDAGGATAWGVTAATWAAALEHGYVAGALADASKADCGLVLRSMFWNTLMCDGMQLGVDLALFNLGMVCGPGRAAAMLETLLGTDPDRIVGPNDLRGAWAAPADALVTKLTAREKAFYAACPTAPRFLRGWDRRADDCQAAALALINTGVINRGTA